jgi:hypothetical protein
MLQAHLPASRVVRAFVTRQNTAQLTANVARAKR